MNGVRRRYAGVAAVGLGVLLVAVAFAAHTHRDYVYARPLDHVLLAIMLAAVAVVVAAGLEWPRHRVLAVGACVLAALVGLPATVLAVIVAQFELDLAPSGRGTVASSDGYEVVAYQQPVPFRSDVLALVIRRRAGLFSRDGDEVACFMAPGAGVGPEWKFAHARFVAKDRIELSTLDGSKSNRCTHAPDPAAD
jgi:hypothetical protein